MILFPYNTPNLYCIFCNLLLLCHRVFSTYLFAGFSFVIVKYPVFFISINLVSKAFVYSYFQQSLLIYFFLLFFGFLHVLIPFGCMALAFQFCFSSLLRFGDFVHILPYFLALMMKWLRKNTPVFNIPTLLDDVSFTVFVLFVCFYRICDMVSFKKICELIRTI